MSEIVDEVVDTAPVETPAALPSDSPIGTAPASSDGELDALLREFAEKTAPKSELPTQEPAQEAPAQDTASEIDAVLRDLGFSEEQKRADGLQSQLNDLRNQMRLAEETKAFNEFSADLTKRVSEINPHVEDDWVRLKLESVAHDPVARLAWETRGIDPKAAALDLQHVQVALMRLQADPMADPAKVQELNKLAYQLNIAAQSPAILRQIRNQIMSDAKKKLPPIDEQGH